MTHGRCRNRHGATAWLVAAQSASSVLEFAKTSSPRHGILEPMQPTSLLTDQRGEFAVPRDRAHLPRPRTVRTGRRR
jgi:hypothetical protein